MKRASYYISVELAHSISKNNVCYGSPQEIQSYLLTLKNIFPKYYLWEGTTTKAGMEYKLKYIIHKNKIRGIANTEDIVNKHTMSKEN